jgi:hypothetical protein
MIYPNGQRALTSLSRPVSGALVACGALQYGGLRGARFNRYVSDTYNKIIGGLPSGYGAQSAVLPIKSGAVSGRVGLTLTPVGAGVLGMPGTGATSITFTVADADGQLISSGSGTASLTFTFDDALLTASVGGTGSASLSITPTALLGALASGEGSAGFTVSIANAQAYPLNDASPLREGTANFAITGTLTPYAIGSMNGSTVDTSVLTVDAIAGGVWSTLAAQYTEGATMGGKLNTASSGGVDLNALAQAVWQHAQRSLSGPQAAQLAEIWQIHGLDPAAPLAVTETSRTAGTVAQTLATDAGTTTVTRTA